ncbi:hypothetical protein [Pseudobacteriovorax antillogorgiicola]|uniref:Uncharacterized protein n=1 Tax=Pseudobacteriovorax antillogorgiicola TaxID=1513793 RepID=A0A1Y6CG97_9BACT|nr:hypothetical protein [Pseudobacteriovorax antillogorgiicola]TCS48707.1 hypothetical protein EDD56_117129 [Pseudobacteriovorax antillogorgiicola]SMF54670.1 hypothetical protein SAMN06296036_11730 [Pseudobacteriovorax antillogorgiicola]
MPASKQNHDLDQFFSTFRREHKTQCQKYGSWRQAVRHQWQFKDLAQETLERVFASQLEKHIALQATSLSIGSINPLLNWQLCPWRKPYSIMYSLSADQRIPPAHRLQINVRVEAALRKHQVELEERYQNKILSPVEHLIEASLPAPLACWDSLIGLYNRRFKQLGLELRACSELGETLILDPRRMQIIFDWQFYQRQAPTILAHRVLRMSYLLVKGMWCFLSLDPVKDIEPILSKNDSRLGLHEICQYWNQTWDRIYQEQLAETLDLVGMIEECLNQDIFELDQEALQHGISINRRAGFLLQASCGLAL